MIKNQFLVPPERLDMPVVQYDFSRLEPNSNGLFRETDLNRELKDQQRITPHIVSQIMEFAATRKGVMILPLPLNMRVRSTVFCLLNRQRW